MGKRIPLALTGGPLWEGTAWVRIFGWLAATLLTLLVVPALYAYIVQTASDRTHSTFGSDTCSVSQES